MKLDLLEKKLKRIPSRPGVYLFKDAEGNFLYVGKAAKLQHRVRSYFQNAPDQDVRTLSLLERVAEIETIATGTEKEAFILEDHLIKQHRPRYNIRLRDDKRYPCLRLSVDEKIPTLSIVRRIQDDGALYFGPLPPGGGEPDSKNISHPHQFGHGILPSPARLDAGGSDRI